MKIATAFVILAVVGFLTAYFVMLAVNYLFTPATLLAVFGVAQFGFWRAYVLSLFCSFLFKSSASGTSK
jgi:hypothetical protein